MLDKAKSFFEKINNSKFYIKLIAFFAVGLITIVLTLVFSNATLAYNVRYGDEIIAQVSNVEIFKAAQKQAAGQISAENASQYIYNPEYTLTLTVSERLLDKDAAAVAILDNTGEIAKSVALSIEGEYTLYAASREELEALIDKRLHAFDNKTYTNTAEFIKRVEIVDVYCPKQSHAKNEDIVKVLSGLDVRTVTKVTSEVVVPYKTVTQKSEEKLVGFYGVTRKGVNGINHTVEQVTYINGKVDKRVRLEQEVVKKPVNEMVTIGTGSANPNDTTGMLFPLPRGTRYVITTYFGAIDDLHAKSHKGVDYAAAGGTPILAAKSGTVLSAKYRGGYGYCVEISHGNGVRTLYAHCSKLLVKTGETVKQGQTIALVGTTGYSTGNHLHFEVIINGRYINPARYF